MTNRPKEGLNQGKLRGSLGSQDAHVDLVCLIGQIAQEVGKRANKQTANKWPARRPTGTIQARRRPKLSLGCGLALGLVAIARAAAAEGT